MPQDTARLVDKIKGGKHTIAEVCDLVSRKPQVTAAKRLSDLYPVETVGN